jgi:thiol-disulfide isomerase/thioredoxin
MVLTKSAETALKQGDLAPEFTLLNVDGRRYSRTDFSGEILVVVFMCNHCPYVKPKMDEIAAIQDEYRNKDVTVICINANDATNYPEDDFDHMKAIAEEKGYEYYLYDEGQDVALAYGAVCTPDCFVFDKGHRLVYRGRINDAMSPNDTPKQHDIREILDSLISGGSIGEWFRPSMGCSVKWKPEHNPTA